MYQVDINGKGGTLYTISKGAWDTHHRGESGCEIKNSIIKKGSKTETYTDVVVVYQWFRD